ncbi:hypothetical protein L3067_13765 [Xanthomonas sp. PPL568]|uniref:hypothetical protein n=1 Tax=Xanthomonas indica TaxID=2912242 RepID=UPI001F57D004|nr:hypothetical protein [Xanthomonas indica]MCI2245671.1 hypothetical protein [Xanthomonas indica]
MQAAPHLGAAILWMAALFAPLAYSAPERASADSLYEQLADLNAHLGEESGQSRGDAVVRRYRQLTARVRACEEEAAHGFNIDDLFKATAYAELYSLEVADVDALGCLYRQLASAGAVTNWHTQTYAGALVTVSRYSEANELRKGSGSPNSPALPDLRIPPAAASAGFRFITLQDRRHAQVEVWNPESHRGHIVAVVHPTCAFSVRALSEIEKNPELQWLRDNLLLVVPPDASLAVNGILAWNTAHPGLPMHPMYLRRDWKVLKSLDTPTFYLVQDGTILASFEGWPNAKGLAAIQAALQR